jgi:hypothetical protein
MSTIFRAVLFCTGKKAFDGSITLERNTNKCLKESHFQNKKKSEFNRLKTTVAEIGVFWGEGGSCHV